jgi:hypothetical protein
MHPIFFHLGWNLDGDWPIRRQNPYQPQFVNVNNNKVILVYDSATGEKNVVQEPSNSRSLEFETVEVSPQRC